MTVPAPPTGRPDSSSRTLVLQTQRNHGLFLQLHELDLIRSILLEWIPKRPVWVFGSRATGVRLKRFSDLDLAIADRLTTAQKIGLAQAFDESPLPFKVDLIELNEIDPAFRTRIEADLVPLPDIALESSASVAP